MNERKSFVWTISPFDEVKLGLFEEEDGSNNDERVGERRPIVTNSLEMLSLEDEGTACRIVSGESEVIVNCEADNRSLIGDLLAMQCLVTWLSIKGVESRDRARCRHTSNGDLNYQQPVLI